MTEASAKQFQLDNAVLWAGLEVSLLPYLEQWLIEHTPANSFDPLEIALADTGIDLSAVVYAVITARAEGIQPRDDLNEAEKMAQDSLEIINDFLGIAGRVNHNLAFQVFELLMRQAEKAVLKNLTGRN